MSRRKFSEIMKDMDKLEEVEISDSFVNFLKYYYSVEEKLAIAVEALEFYAYPKHEDGDRAYIFGHEARKALKEMADE